MEEGDDSAKETEKGHREVGSVEVSPPETPGTAATEQS